jgi:hypothetical protein
VSLLGSLKTCHQPFSWKSGGESSEVSRRPSVGTSQMRPIATRRNWTGALLSARTIFAEALSSSRRGRGTSTASVAI